MSDGSVKMGKYRLYCGVSDSEAEYPVSEMIERLPLTPQTIVHIDLVLPDDVQPEALRLTVRASGNRKQVDAVFNPVDWMLFRDGDRLHVAPFSVGALFDEGHRHLYGDKGAMEIVLYVKNTPVAAHTIPLEGIWPPPAGAGLSIETASVDALMAELADYQGWSSFKARMRELVDRCEVGILRHRAGLNMVAPCLHTVVAGNPGSGKTACVRWMARLCKSLGLLETNEVWTTCVSELATSRVNGEAENLKEAIGKARGGTLVFENAHELYKTENKGNYDTEGQLVRVLEETLNEEGGKRWMLVLTGDHKGLDSLLSVHPNLKNHLSEPIFLEDFRPEELFGMFDTYCRSSDLVLSPEARQKLEMYVLYKYNHRGPGFQNAHLVGQLFRDRIVPAMFRRLNALAAPSAEQLQLVLPEDIPALGLSAGDALAGLDELVGLGKIKGKIRDYLQAVRLASRRMEMGLPTNMPRLHMAFLGNPGTGKTTVAEIIGKIFASWGILSGGHVIHTERSQMVGQYIGETEFKMKNLLSRARGNILFIDEAYQLVESDNSRDFGHIVMDSLLTELGRDNQDMVVILAGYTAPMKKLLESNEGIESRFPNVFNFEDYTTDELLEIAQLMIRRQGFVLADGAVDNLRAIIQEESEKPSPRFGNGRFVSNLLQNEILSTLGARTSAIPHPTREDLSTILPEDVVIGKAQKDVVFDDVAIDAALARLDTLAGLAGVKKAIHNFVQSARYLHSIGEPYVGKGLLSWRFIGNSGTGKSTVAEIMACILKGMRLIANSHITEIEGERIFNVSEADCYRVLEEAVKRSCNGLIFIDADAPDFQSFSYGKARDVEQIRLKIKELTVESGGECALILAELDAPFQNVVEQLQEAGVYEFDHTLVFEDFTPEELYRILCSCLAKFKVGFSPAAESHMMRFLEAMKGYANARTMKLMSRTIYQQVILRESGLQRRPSAHQVQLADIASFKWNGKRGKIGY